MQSSLAHKPVRSIASSFSTFRRAPRATLPFKLKFESSAHCNLKCTMCPLNIGLKRKQGFLSFDNFKYVFDQVKPAYLNLTGIGEPFLNPDIFKIVIYAKQRGAMVKFDTNAMLLGPENRRKILDTCIDVLSISIDGVDKKSFESIRIGSDFRKVINNVKELVEERNKRKTLTKIHTFFILQENNIEKLPEFIKQADELGVDYVAGSFVVTLGKNENKKNKLFKQKKSIAGLLEKTKKAITNAKAEVSVGPLLEYLDFKGNKTSYNEEKPCFMPWYSTFITWDGWVNPCDFSCDNEVVFGNAFKVPFKDIWNNKKLQEFRMQLLKNRKRIHVCKSCGVDETFILKEMEKTKKIPFFKYLIYGQ
jgi:radical SAM protein with 4Fe4S-binding SPASM domain